MMDKISILSTYYELIRKYWNQRHEPQIRSRIITFYKQIQRTTDDKTEAEEAKNSISLLEKEQSLLNGKNNRKQSTDMRTGGQSLKKNGAKVQVPEEAEEPTNQFLVVEKPDTNFSHVAGLGQTKVELCRAVEWPLKYPEYYSYYALEPQKGIMIFGPSGCGKTHIARCCAGEFGVSFVLAEPANINSHWHGKSERNVALCFQTARQNAPSILYIDETDLLLPKSTTSSVTPKVVGEFQIQMDGFQKHRERVIVIMSSNRPWKIHQHLIRRGRIDRIIYVGQPDEQARAKVFQLNLENTPLDSDVSFEELAKRTAPSANGFYYSCSDVKEIARTAKEEALDEAVKKGHKTPVGLRHLEIGFDKAKPSISEKDVQKYQEWANDFASAVD